MLVRWDTEDLTEIVQKLLPAYIDLVSLNGRHLSFSSSKNNFQEFAEAISCNLMNFFLENCPCSLLLIQDRKDFNDIANYYAYWVTSTTRDQEIILSYRIVPKPIIQKHFLENIQCYHPFIDFLT